MPATTRLVPTISKMIEIIKTLPDLKASTRKAMVSALNRLGEIANLDVHSVPMDPPTIRKAFEHAAWQQHNINKATWLNIKSLVKAAMEIVGIRVHRQRANYVLSPGWLEILNKVGEREAAGLRRFAGWCTIRQCEPLDVTQAVFLTYLEYCIEVMTLHNPRERCHVVRRAWNRSVRPIFEYKIDELIMPGLDQWFALTWNDLPESFRVELDSVFSENSTDQHFAGINLSALAKFAANPASNGKLLAAAKRKTLKPVTIEGYRKNIRIYATLLSQLGIDVKTFVNFDTMMHAGDFGEALDSYIRGGDYERAKPRLAGVLFTLISVTRRLMASGRVATDILPMLKAAEEALDYQPKGFSPRVQKKIEQFYNPQVAGRFLDLPFQVFERLAKVKQPMVKHALEAQSALIVALLIVCPVRAKNMAALDLAKHMKKLPDAKEPRWILRWDKQEVKNDKDLTFQVRGRRAEILETYLDRYRPLLLHGHSKSICVSQSGKTKSAHVLGRQFRGFVKRATGLDLNIHAVRHLCAYLYLKENPGQYEVIRQLLGHKDLWTTIEFYACFNDKTDQEAHGLLMDQLAGCAKSQAEEEDTL